MATPSRPKLRLLADALGVFREYEDANGRRHVTTDSTRQAILTAWGFDVSSEAAADGSLAKLRLQKAREIIAPTCVVRAGERAASSVLARLPRDLSGRAADWQVDVESDSGRPLQIAGALSGRRRASRIRLGLRRKLAEGYHSVRLTVSTSTQTLVSQQILIVVPDTCFTVHEAIGRRRVFGLSANLYSIRSERNWGIGDLSDLGDLVRGAARKGAVFVGINPLHALRNHGEYISPYSPLSRLYGNLVYLDVESVPEFATCRAAKVTRDSASFRGELKLCRAAALVDYPRVAGLKAKILRELFADFSARHTTGSTARGRAYRRYVDGEGAALTDFATFLALSDRLSSTHGDDWRTWPVEFRNPHSPEVLAFQRDHAAEIDFHRYVQFELDRQIAGSVGSAARPRMQLGLYQDLALGSAGNGSDAWSFAPLFLHDLHVGCPPDAHSSTGQDWSFPPVDPVRLRADGFRYWGLMLWNIFRHSGIVRIDHVMGLFRQFWIPEGQPPTNGTYVAMPSDELLGILALESRRSRTVVVGEDLGTVPRGLPAQLARRGILSSRVLMFERSVKGGFKAAASYSRRALVTANTHDLPPLVSWLTGRDLELRREVERRRPAGKQRSQSQLTPERRSELEHLLRRLKRDGVAPVGDHESAWPFVDAVYRFLARVPAPLLGVSLDDLGMEDEPVNLPGISPLVHPSWSRKMRQTPDAILRDKAAARLLQYLARARSGISGKTTTR